MKAYGELDLVQMPAEFKYLAAVLLPELSDIASAAQKPHSGYTFLPHFQIKVTPFLLHTSQSHTHPTPPPPNPDRQAVCCFKFQSTKYC